MIIFGIKQGQKKSRTRSWAVKAGLFAVFLVLGQLCGSFIFASELNMAYAQTSAATDLPVAPAEATPRRAAAAGESTYRVQAVLSPRRRAVISGAMDGKIAKFNVENGDIFDQGAVLIEYDCAVDYARLKELQSKQRASQAQLEAYEKLKQLESASKIELMMAREANEQNKAQVDQIRGRLKMCKVIAPFDGRVTNKMASQYEYVQTGRVLMDVTSSDALRAQFLIPSKWLQWLNIGTPVDIFINEVDRSYSARIVTIHGEVDPVSQTVQVVAEMESYHEELLPGMSGMATFNPEVASSGLENGFLGMMLQVDWTDGKDKK